jgi:hypothetical protein
VRDQIPSAEERRAYLAPAISGTSRLATI